jgi:hypothetical protein
MHGVAGLLLVLDVALALTEGDDSSRSRVLVQIGKELVNSGACACTSLLSVLADFPSMCL